MDDDALKHVLFISYRSTDQARAQAIVDALNATQAVRTTFSKDDLRDAQEWKPQLYRWLARCDAGFVLVTEEVMKKPEWVLQEATILRARMIEEQSTFRLFLLIDDGVEAHDNWRLFAPLELGAVQRLPTGQTPAQTAAKVVQALPEIGPRSLTYFARLEGRLKHYLDLVVGQNEQATLELRKEMQLEDAHWQTIVGRGDAIASHAAQRLCQGDLGTFNSLDSLFASLAWIPQRENKLALIAMLRTYWIALHPLAALSDMVAGRAPRLVLIHTRSPSVTVDMCFDRHYGPYGSTVPTRIRVSAGNEPVEASDVLAAYRKNRKSDGPEWTDEETRDEMRRSVNVRQQRLLVVLPEVRDLDSVIALTDELPMCSFLAPTLQDLAKQAGVHGAVWVSLAGTHSKGWRESDFVADFGFACNRI